MTRGALCSHGGVVVAATPYPWPYHGALTPARTALVACCDPSWRPARPDADRADGALAAIAASVRRIGGLVVVLAATPARRRPADTVVPARTPVADPDAVAIAAGISGFHGGDLDGRLRAAGTTDLILAGWGLEGPVHSTLRAANDRGYECLLVCDASVATEPDLTFAALDMVRHSGGIFGAFATTDAVLEPLNQISGGQAANLDLEAR